MVKVARGYLRMGLEKQDSLWGKQTPVKDVSVDGFWMDETEVTNSKYKQFVMWVRDSIIRTRLADPQYGGDETYMITEDKNGDQPVSVMVSAMRLNSNMLFVVFIYCCFFVFFFGEG